MKKKKEVLKRRMIKYENIREIFEDESQNFDYRTEEIRIRKQQLADLATFTLENKSERKISCQNLFDDGEGMWEVREFYK